MMDNEFPAYRKSSNNRNWYKILDDRNFLEIQKIGSRYVSYDIEATQYPEMLRIRDMLSCVQGYEICDRKEFENILNLL